MCPATDVGRSFDGRSLAPTPALAGRGTPCESAGSRSGGSTSTGWSPSRWATSTRPIISGRLKVASSKAPRDDLRVLRLAAGSIIVPRLRAGALLCAGLLERGRDLRPLKDIR